MKWTQSFIFIFFFFSTYANAKQVAEITVLQVTVTPKNYVIAWSYLRPNVGINRSKTISYQKSDELTKALKKSPLATNVMLIPSPDLKKKRLEETIAIIEKAGYKGKIGMIGNEVFY